jgi:hypothetical protein
MGRTVPLFWESWMLRPPLPGIINSYLTAFLTAVLAQSSIASDLKLFNCSLVSMLGSFIAVWTWLQRRYFQFSHGWDFGLSWIGCISITVLLIINQSQPYQRGEVGRIRKHQPTTFFYTNDSFLSVELWERSSSNGRKCNQRSWQNCASPLAQEGILQRERFGETIAETGLQSCAHTRQQPKSKSAPRHNCAERFRDLCVRSQKRQLLRVFP